MTREARPIPVAIFNTEPRPQWIALSRDRFPNGTLGHDLFPEGLEGRLRPETVYDLPAASLFNPNNHTARAQLEAAGIQTCRDALCKPYDPKMDQFGKMGFQLAQFLTGLTVTPQGRLLQDICDYGKTPLPADREAGFVQAVNMAVDTLIRPDTLKLDDPIRSWLILVRMYGLRDGIPHTYAEISRMPEFSGVTPKRITTLRYQALRLLWGEGDEKAPISGARKLFLGQPL